MSFQLTFQNSALKYKWRLITRQTLNQLSHPGTPKCYFLKRKSQGGRVVRLFELSILGFVLGWSRSWSWDPPALHPTSRSVGSVPGILSPRTNPLTCILFPSKINLKIFMKSKKENSNQSSQKLKKYDSRIRKSNGRARKHDVESKTKIQRESKSYFFFLNQKTGPWSLTSELKEIQNTENHVKRRESSKK